VLARALLRKILPLHPWLSSSLFSKVAWRSDFLLQSDASVSGCVCVCVCVCVRMGVLISSRRVGFSASPPSHCLCVFSTFIGVSFSVILSETFCWCIVCMSHCT